MDHVLTTKLLEVALTEAVNQNVAVTIAVVDLGGHLTALQRMTGCSFFAVEASRKKAVTSSQLKAPTHALAEISQKIPELQKAFDQNDQILTLPGGFPIFLDDQLIGGLGVAGGDFKQDRSIAEKAIQSIKK